MPSRREPGSARSRAAASAVTFEIVPPLVNAPAAAGKPTNSLTHRTAWSSTSDAAPAHTARLTSKHEASRSPSTPISSPDEPTNAKKRGRGWAIDIVEQLRRVVERRERARPALRERGAEQLVEPLVDVRLPGPRPVEALPRAGNDRRRALERLLAGGVEAERGELGGGAHRRELVPEQGAGLAQSPRLVDDERRDRLARARRGRRGCRPRPPIRLRPPPSRPRRTSAGRCPSTSTAGGRGRPRRPRSRRRRARPCRSPCPSAGTGSARSARAARRSGRRRRAPAPSPGTRSAASTSSGSSVSPPPSPGGRERLAHPWPRGRGRPRASRPCNRLLHCSLARRRISVIATPPRNRAPVAARAAAPSDGQRIVEPVERPLEDVEDGDLVAGRGEGRRALRPDQARADHDDPPGGRGERLGDVRQARRGPR